MSNEEQLKKARNQIGVMAFKAVWNACWDHYTDTDTYQKSHNQDHAKAYWKKRIGITGVQTVDDYIMKLVKPHVDNGLTEIDDIARKVKRSLGI